MRRRGRCTCDDSPFEYPCRRRVSLGGGATHASLRRRHRRNDCHRCADNHLLGYIHRGSGYRLRLDEGGRRHGDDRARHLPIRVHDVGHVDVVVGVVDNRVVDHGVAAVDVFVIAAAHRIRGLIDLARPEREPRDATDVAAGDRDLEVRAAHEHDQCRRVIGASTHGAGYPSPCATEIRPATVVGHGEAPRRVIHPCPTPRVDPRPMSVAIRRPAGGHAIRDPYVAVARVNAPGAVRIEVLIADHVGRYVAGGDRGVVAAIAIVRPAIEFVESRRFHILVLAQARPHEPIRLSRIDDIRRVFAVHLTLAIAHDDRRRIAIGIHFDPVFAGSPEGEGEIRRIDLEHLVGFETAHANVHYALRQLQLSDSIIEIQNGYRRAGAHANQCAADLDFGPRTGIGPEAVAGGERPIDRGLYPIVFPGGRKTDGAGHVAETRDARRWICAGQAAEGQECDARHEGENPKT